MRQKASEALIARGAVAELQRQGFTTYEEVSTGYGGNRADIVGLSGARVCVVETKTSMSLVLMNQLLEWRGRAHWIIGAVGYGKHRGAAERFFKSEGFGLWQVQESGHDSQVKIDEVVAPRLHRYAHDAPKRLRARCVDENRTGSEYAAAGSAAGGYYTPFRRTARSLAAAVRAQPGIDLTSALATLKHHYQSPASARSSLPGCIVRGIVPGVRLEHDGKLIRLFPVGCA